MEVHLPPEVQTKLEQRPQDTGRPSDELVENVMTDFFGDIASTRVTLDRRYDDLESGRVKLIPGDEVFARLRARSAARRVADDSTEAAAHLDG
jgi:hypothetical protein